MSAELLQSRTLTYQILEFSVSDDPNVPLADSVVLNFGQVFPGPCATLLMAKAGTERHQDQATAGKGIAWRAPLPNSPSATPISTAAGSGLSSDEIADLRPGGRDLKCLPRMTSG